MAVPQPLTKPTPSAPSRHVSAKQKGKAPAHSIPLATPAMTSKTRKRATPESEDLIDNVPETHHTSTAVHGVPKDIPVVEVELQRASGTSPASGTLPQVPVVAVDSASPP